MDLTLGLVLDKLIRRRQLARFESQDTPKSPAPWEDWELDRKFLKAMKHWTINHPETTLDRILDNIRDRSLDTSDLLGLIPDSPFPARGLVGALAYLIKLGATIYRANSDVQALAKSITQWVKVAFESSGNSRFTRTTWRNLQNMRSLIDEICKWTAARLEDGRWSRIGHGLQIQREVAEFRTRLSEARALFMDVSVINLSGSLGAISEDLRVLFKQHNRITSEIESIRQRQAEQLLYIINELDAQKEAEERRKFLSRTLLPHTVANPTYDQQGKQPCDDGTRIEVLDEITKWIHDISYHSKNFLWLTGDPGCGKSAITASIARYCKDKGILWAQFFINRNNIDTTNPNSYFPSIASQLADHSPAVARAIHDTLKRQPSLMDGISAAQAAKLFIDALGSASKQDTRNSAVVVIDGLDETDRRRLSDTAIIFSELFTGLSKYRNAKVFISSRTEDAIRNPFAQNMNPDHVKHIHLDTAAKSSINDVSLFLQRKVAEIVVKNDLNWTEWPGDRRMKNLTLRASGLFIWAVTVAKFLQEQIDTWGTECLNDVLDALDIKGMGDINMLYSTILRLTYTDLKDEWAFETFRRVVGAIVVLHEPLSR